MQIGTVFKILTSREILRTQNLHQVNIVRFRNHTFVSISWMCKKQTADSHSSTESEIISLDTGLRLDGLPALELWYVIVCLWKYFSYFRSNAETCAW